MRGGEFAALQAFAAIAREHRHEAPRERAVHERWERERHQRTHEASPVYR